jgi:hypothetical protein
MMVGGLDGVKVRVWRERFLRFDDSGMTISEFCSAEGVSKSSYYAWRRKVGQPTGDRGVAAGGKLFEPVTIAFGAVKIRLPDGTLIEVPCESAIALRTIVGQLVCKPPEVARC